MAGLEGGREETGLVKSFSLHVPFKTTEDRQWTGQISLEGNLVTICMDSQICLSHSRLVIKFLITAAFITAYSNPLKSYCFIFFSLPCCILNDVFTLPFYFGST